jgi:hypothetical protein
VRVRVRAAGSRMQCGRLEGSKLCTRPPASLPSKSPSMSLPVLHLPRDFFFKIIVAGDAGVGKSSLVNRFLYDAFSDTRISLPVGPKHSVRASCTCVGTRWPPRPLLLPHKGSHVPKRNAGCAGWAHPDLKRLPPSSTFCNLNVSSLQETILVQLREPFATDDMIAKLIVVRRVHPGFCLCVPLPASSRDGGADLLQQPGCFVCLFMRAARRGVPQGPGGHPHPRRKDPPHGHLILLRHKPQDHV